MTFIPTHAEAPEDDELQVIPLPNGGRRRGGQLGRVLLGIAVGIGAILFLLYLFGSNLRPHNTQDQRPLATPAATVAPNWTPTRPGSGPTQGTLPPAPPLGPWRP
jgi:hypothetical protein